MDQSSGTRDARYANLNYSIGMMGSDAVTEIYGRPSTSQLQTRTNSACSAVTGSTSDTAGSTISGSVNMISQSNAVDNSSISIQRSLKRTSTDVCYDDNTNETRQVMSQTQTLISDNTDESYTNLGPPKKSPPSNGKKTKGRVKIKMEYIDNKLRRYTTFSKRKTGIMKKAYELSTLTGTQVMLLVASETGHVYTFATRKLQPMITSEAGKALIQTCLNSPDPPPSGSSGDQRMSATGFEETELTYNITEDEQKVEINNEKENSDIR
ncbi:PREDICTED: serum response factor homolog isoform X2 [Ceratosolen solmsi marchali]|uniref:Serum response factor homolog n=1 Tax=Ceratosolen solmsi marchali TaxID=326594 RepID=A0AAJ6YQE0_9HYME|nr:PREDICTED: serum response factor homolog isoform X2 [Ceratosolen solmsi marchali]